MPRPEESCVHQYFTRGELRSDLSCPNNVDFTVQAAGQPPRRACSSHLLGVIWDMMEELGKEYSLTVRAVPVSQLSLRR